MADAILFDESHGQRAWWGIAPTVASGFGRAAVLAGQRWRVAFVAPGSQLTPALLADYRALVLAIGPQGKTQLTDAEIGAVQDFVAAGGGLLVLSIYTGDWHHEANLNRLLESYGIACNNDVILPAGALPVMGFEQGSERQPDSPCAVTVRPLGTAAVLGQGIGRVRTLSSCSLYVDEDAAVSILAADGDATYLAPVPRGQGIHIDKYLARGSGPAVVMAAARRQRVVVSGSWKLFLDSFLDDTASDNGQLFMNVLDWLTTGVSAPLPAAAASSAARVRAPQHADLRARRQDLRALLVAVEHEAVLATGFEKAALSVRSEKLRQEIAAVEAEIDAGEGP